MLFAKEYRIPRKMLVIPENYTFTGHKASNALYKYV